MRKTWSEIRSWKTQGEQSNHNESLTPVKERGPEGWWKLYRQQHNLRKVHQICRVLESKMKSEDYDVPRE